MEVTEYDVWGVGQYACSKTALVLARASRLGVVGRRYP
jgi:hypothetical protein